MHKFFTSTHHVANVNSNFKLGERLMYYGITTFSYDPEREKDVINWLNSARAEMQSLPGVQYGRGVRIASGQSMMIGAYDTKQSADDARNKVSGLRHQMESVLNRPVEVVEGPVIWEI